MRWPANTPFWTWPPSSANSPWVWPPTNLPAVDPSLPPLPASAVEYWHAERGASVTQAIGQILGIVLPAIGTPILAPDPGYFNERNVFRSVPLTAGWASSTAPPLAVIGDRPWMFIIGRLRALDPDNVPYSVLFKAGGTLDMFRLSGRVSKFELLRYRNFVPLEVTSLLDQNLKANYFIIENDATFGLRGNVSGLVRTLTNANAQSGLLADLAPAVGIGCEPGAVASTAGDTSVAFVLVCKSMPTAAEKQALIDWAASYWGVPSL